MNIDKKQVKFFIIKSEDARLSERVLQNVYGYNRLEFFENKDTDTQGYILNHENHMIISFRGSQQTQDWFTDFNAFQITYPGYGKDNSNSEVKVHQGFYGAYKSVRDIIFESIKNNKPLKVSVCGHSLGGALATLCALDLQYNFEGVFDLEVYTSGQPKVGNKAFAESFNRRVPKMIRTYMKKDIVPSCPPKITNKLVGKFNHVGIPNPIGPRLFMFGLFNWIVRLNKKKFIENLTNHSIYLYMKFA